MKILILGDVGASINNELAFSTAEKDLFSAEIQDICARADIVLLNLEKPLTDIITPLGKCPPDYVAPTKTINGIKLLNPTAVTLANNHIMDQQLQGLKSTIDVLTLNGIQFVGAGDNLQEARKPLIIEKKETKIGIYACCEKEFSFATEDTPGANVYDPLVTFDDIEELRKSCDYLIVLFHGGMQGYPYPTPYQQKICRKMCKKGANLVVCQHSHIIGCEESFANGTIIYGQGNFLLDELDADSWRSGLILDISLEECVKKIDIIPIEVCNHKSKLHQNSKLIKQLYYERSSKIADRNFVTQAYTDYCTKKLPDYLMKLSGVGSIRRKLIQKFKMQKYYIHKYHSQELNYILDYMYCDTHREAIIKSIETINDK